MITFSLFFFLRKKKKYINTFYMIIFIKKIAPNLWKKLFILKKLINNWK